MMLPLVTCKIFLFQLKTKKNDYINHFFFNKTSVTYWITITDAVLFDPPFDRSIHLSRIRIGNEFCIIIAQTTIFFTSLLILQQDQQYTTIHYMQKHLCTSF